jgi:hypothetical protein
MYTCFRFDPRRIVISVKLNGTLQQHYLSSILTC